MVGRALITRGKPFSDSPSREFGTKADLEEMMLESDPHQIPFFL
jgi:hypothetical protein